MKNIYKKAAVLMLLLSITISCDLDSELDNPNEVPVKGADPDLIMNAIQMDFGDFFSLASGNSVYPDHVTVGVDRLMRMRTMSSGYRYQTAFQAQYLDDLWVTAYQKILANIENLIPLATEKNFTTHIAVAKILKAYTYLILVDLFGDVPKGKALQGLKDLNPEADNGESIYNEAIALLGEARTELAKEDEAAGDPLDRDVYYDGDRDKWNALANTLELKAWLNLSMMPSRKAEADAKIATFINTTDGSNQPGIDLVDTEEENFTYKYGTKTVPVSRHPLYRQYYGPSEASAIGYICNSFLYELYNGKGVEDPRWRYYFYRQVGSIVRANQVDPKSVGCSVGAIPNHYSSGGHIFCTFEPGFYGRDHGDASGTPPDSPVITCAGAYPAGGRADTNPTSVSTYYSPTEQGQGGDGAGIEPIFMSFFTDYLKAEILARGGQTAAAKTMLLGAVQKSITQVKNFSLSIGESAGAQEPSTPAYLNAVGTMYDGASNKLKVIGREFYVACWGSAIEAYNSYRRTSGPDNMQPTLQVGAGPWLRSLVFPAVYVNLNGSASAVQKDLTQTNRVFWDTNPDNLN